MPKTKWDGAEEPTISILFNNSIRLITETFEYALKSADRPKPIAVDTNTPLRQVSSGVHKVHPQRHMPSGKNQLERDF